MRADRPAASVIIAARDAEATITQTLAALDAQRLDREYEVIVVDDGSSDRTAELVRAHKPAVTLLESGTTRGPGTARNAAAQVARGEVLAFTDADCFPTPDWLAQGLEALANRDLIQGAVEPDPEVPRAPFDRTVTVSSESGFYETANLFVRRELFDRIGGFEDWILEDGAPPKRTIGEDVLFGWEARRVGARTGFAEEARVHHAVFRKRPSEALRYRWAAMRYLPMLATRIPELRAHAFYRRWFFNQRSASFDLAALGVVLALVLRRRAALVAILPYARRLGREAAAWREFGSARVALTTLGTDAVCFAALVEGSARSRSLLL